MGHYLPAAVSGDDCGVIKEGGSVQLQGKGHLQHVDTAK